MTKTRKHRTYRETAGANSNTHCTYKIRPKEAKKIAKRIHSKSNEEVVEELHKLQKLTCRQAIKASARTTLGNNIVDAFTLVERLHTRGDQKVSFYEFWDQRNTYKKEPRVKNMLDFYKSRNIDEIRKYKYIYNLYFSSIAIFRPIMAMEVYCRVKARRVLDFTMGWGGRLVGACALNLEAYYGVDINQNLKTPYKQMVDLLEESSDIETKIELFFKDALKMDYSKMDYDTVFTSPPYYNTEVYRKDEKSYQLRQKEVDWNTRFYQPVLLKTYQHLKVGGNYCLNVPEKVYTSVCIPLLGKCTRKILLKKGKRTAHETYKEYIYVWHKGERSEPPL